MTRFDGLRDFGRGLWQLGRTVGLYDTYTKNVYAVPHTFTERRTGNRKRGLEPIATRTVRRYGPFVVDTFKANVPRETGGTSPKGQRTIHLFPHAEHFWHAAHPTRVGRARTMSERYSVGDNTAVGMLFKVAEMTERPLGDIHVFDVRNGNREEERRYIPSHQ